MRFTLDKQNLAALLLAFSKDKLAKGSRKIKQHGLDRFTGTVEATGEGVHVKSGRIDLNLAATVEAPGKFAIRNAVLRTRLKTLRGERSLSVVADASGLTINGLQIQLPSDDYSFSHFTAHEVS